MKSLVAITLAAILSLCAFSMPVQPSGGALALYGSLYHALVQLKNASSH
jgi:hypothetical protein